MLREDNARQGFFEHADFENLVGHADAPCERRSGVLRKADCLKSLQIHPALWWLVVGSCSDDPPGQQPSDRQAERDRYQERQPTSTPLIDHHADHVL